MKKIFVSMSLVFSFLTVAPVGMAGFNGDPTCRGKYQKTGVQLKKIRAKANKKGSAAHGYSQNCTTKGKGKFWKRRKNL